MTKYGYSLLKSLPAFEAVARLHSVSKAAAELYVTAGSVSRHIKHIERFVGRPLFQRTHSTIVSNEDGALLHNAIDTATLCIRRALTQITGAQVANRLVISADPDFGGIVAGAAAGRLLHHHSRHGRGNTCAARCAFDARPAHQLRDSLHGGRFGSGRGRDAVPLAALSGSLRSTAYRPGARFHWDDLRFHKLLHDRSFGEWAQYLQACGAVIDIDLHSGIVFSETSMCLEAAVRGQGVALGGRIPGCDVSFGGAAGAGVRPDDSVEERVLPDRVRECGGASGGQCISDVAVTDLATTTHQSGDPLSGMRTGMNRGSLHNNQRNTAEISIELHALGRQALRHRR